MKPNKNHNNNNNKNQTENIEEKTASNDMQKVWSRWITKMLHKTESDSHLCQLRGIVSSVSPTPCIQPLYSRVCVL